MSRKDSIKTRQNKIKTAFLEQLKRTPTIETSCQKIGISRATVYRWMKTGKKFEVQVDEALHEGRTFMSDIAENQLFSLIGEKKIEAIRLFLSTHNARYSNKIEVSGSVSTDQPLNKEQKRLICEALADRDSKSTTSVQVVAIFTNSWQPFETVSHTVSTPIDGTKNRSPRGE